MRNTQKKPTTNCCRLFCLLGGLALFSLNTNHALAVGAVTPFTTLEAEAGTLGGGATVVSLTSAPTNQYSSPPLEASGHSFVALTATGQYVQWTNNTGQNITAINLRSCIPDAPTGGGISNTIDLYVDGVFRQAFSVNSMQNYCYEGVTYNSSNDKNPADGAPRDFWNDTHAFISGAAVAPGSTIRFQMDSSNTAAFYYIDVVDLENPPAPLAQPANSLSILSYGASANDPNFDNTSAINNCFSAAQSQGKIAWIPAGTFYISALSGGLNATGITIAGAGPWYSTIYRWTPANNTVGVPNIINAVSCSLSNVLLDCNSWSRDNANNNGAVDFSGTNWVVNNVWIQHTTSSFWCAGVNGIAENCRTLSTWADGGNFNNVQDVHGVGMNLVYSNNFVRGTGDDAMAINSVAYNGSTTYTPMTNITYVNNTGIAAWGGKNLGIYGGGGVTVQNNYLSDTARFLGLGAGRFGVNGSDLTSATVSGNTVVRCGGNGYSQQQAGLHVGNGGDGQNTGIVKNVTVTNNLVVNSLYDGVAFSTCSNINFINNIISTPGLGGIAISPPYFPATNGWAFITGNTVTNLNPFQIAFTNYSSNFTAYLSGNTFVDGPTGILLSRVGWVATASVNSSSAPLALDGNPTTRWTTGAAQVGGEWFQVDMLTNQPFYAIVLDNTAFPGDYPRGYQVNVSTDGINWGSPVATGAGNPNNLTAITFPTQTARYIRVTQTGSSGGNWWSIGEFNVYVQGTVPPAPTGLTATAVSSSQINLSWTASSGATSYNVKSATVSGGPYTTTATSVTTTSYSNTGLSSSTTYYYVVSAVNGAGESSNSTQASATTLAGIAPPTGLSAAGGNLVVNLKWTQSTSSGITGNNVYRSTNGTGGPYNLLASLAATTSYSDTSVAAGNTYYYSVTAVNANGESAMSAYAGATTIPPAPTGLSATAGNNQVALSWTAATGATSYNVKRATLSGGPYTTLTNVTTTSFTDTTAVNGTTYYYVVSAVNSSGESANSTQVSATPSAPAAPNAPTGLTATAQKQAGKIKLAWTQSTSANITTNNVYRATVSGGPYSRVASIAATTVYTDSGLTSGTTYYFVVTAVNSSGLEGPYSNQASATAK